MEGRDSTSSPSSSSTTAPALAPAPARDGSSPADTTDDAGFSVYVALAKDAALHFQSGKFTECVEVLNQLLQKKQDDPKVTIFTFAWIPVLPISSSLFLLHSSMRSDSRNG